MFRSFFTTIFRGSSAVLCAVTIPPADMRSLSSYYYTVCGRMCMSSVCVWCSCLLVICLWTLAVLCLIATGRTVSDTQKSNALCNNVNLLSYRRLPICKEELDAEHMFWIFCIICVCLVFLPVGDLLVNSSQADHQQTRTTNTHRWHTHAATYCVIRTQRTQISGRNGNGTKHSGRHPEDGREKRPKHVEVLYLQTRF